MAYYPFGKKLIMSEEEVIKRERKFQLFDYYGIPYGLLDGDVTRMDKEFHEARMLIEQGKPVSMELEKRLLEYKRNKNI